MKSCLSKCRSTLLVLLGAVAMGCAASPPQSPQQAAADEALAARIHSALGADEIHFYRHVNVEVDKGVVQLSGYVWDMDDMYHAKQLVGSIPGVVKVVNQMQLERNGNRGGGHSGSG